MPRVKIQSNPYERSIRFFEYDEHENAWNEIVESRTSKLVRKEFREGFLPFKIYDILEVLLEEYSHPVELEFEGPDDEWIELQGAASLPRMKEAIVPARSKKALADASFVLPEARAICSELKPIIDRYCTDGDSLPKIDRLDRVLSTQVPVCVLGNYSSGKSTFINALIGAELLPSSDKPMTSRVYRIERSDSDCFGSIELRFNESSTTIECKGTELSFIPDSLPGRIVADLEQVSSDENESTIDVLRKALLAVNSYRPSNEEAQIGDIVNVVSPFGSSDPWYENDNLVLFDTPGSNVATNDDHKEALKNAMEGMADGLPIYVTEYSSLDSSDNDTLCDFIQNTNTLDDRFAMIVVNKSDDADLPEGTRTDHDSAWDEWIDDTKSYAVVSKLKGQGVFFASSVVGLGAKTAGEFSDRHYDKVFNRLRDSYEDPSDKYYTRLFDYNIIPPQDAPVLEGEATALDNALLANSGFYSMEKCIVEFACKYSPYDKCSQSLALLSSLAARASDTIGERERDIVERVNDINVRFSEINQSLGTSIGETASRLTAEAGSHFWHNLTGWSVEKEKSANLDLGLMEQWRQEIAGDKTGEHRVKEAQEDARRKQCDILPNLWRRASREAAKGNVGGVFGAVGGLVGDVDSAQRAVFRADQALQRAGRDTRYALVERLKVQFGEQLSSLLFDVDHKSKEYWSNECDSFKSQILDAVRADIVDESERDAIESAIMQFESIDQSTDVSQLLAIQNPFNPMALFELPLSANYHFQMIERLKSGVRQIGDAHWNEFVRWSNDLVKVIVDRLESINPELRGLIQERASLQSQLESIQKDDKRISEGLNKFNKLSGWQIGE